MFHNYFIKYRVPWKKLGVYTFLLLSLYRFFAPGRNVSSLTKQSRQRQRWDPEETDQIEVGVKTLRFPIFETLRVK